VDRACRLVRLAEPSHGRVASPNIGEAARLGMRDERRLNVGRSDGVHSDAAARPFGSKRLCQMVDGGL
jgi:hypothetical protein